MSENENQEKIKKLPFNAFRKGAMTLALAGVMVTAPMMLAGCDNSLDLKGATFYTGTEYSADKGEVGDFFYDTDDCDIYQKTDAGWTLLSNIKGDTGAAWITGDAVTGTDSSITATVANARIGDLYLNNTGPDAGNLYQCTGVNTWKFLININGEDGQTPNPIKGDRGATWLVGSLVTGTGNSITVEVQDAVVGDLYLNNAGDDAGNLYQCIGVNTWKFLININGEDGEDGETPNPIKGDRGATWLVGPLVTTTGDSITVAVQDAVVGDLYLNNTGTDAGNLYQCIGVNTWKFLININGEDGATPQNGERGSLWTTGSGAPTADANTKANDMYFDKTGNVIYQYDGTEWVSISTLTSSNILENYYYSVTSEKELLDLIADGAKCFKLNKDVTLTQKLAPTSDMDFDLNNFTLSYEGVTKDDRLEIKANQDNPINVEFRNGTMNFVNQAKASTIVISTGCSITLRDVHYTSNSTALYPRGDTAKVEVIDSTIIANGYAVGTNASLLDGVPQYKGIKIILKDSVLTSTSTDYDNTAVMINVPGTLNIDGCELTGDKQALLARGGDTVVKNSTLTCTGEYLKKNPTYAYQPTVTDKDPDTGMPIYTFADWATGNNVPSAALVVGNKSTSAYQYVTNIELSATEIISKRMNTPKIIAIGNAATSSDFIGANITMKDMQFSEEFMFTTILGDNLNIRTMISTYEELEMMLQGIEQGFPITPVLANDLASYDMNMYVEEYMLIQEILNAKEADRIVDLNGYTIHTPIFDLMKQCQVAARTYAGIEYALETIETGSVVLENGITVSATEFAKLQGWFNFGSVRNDGHYSISQIVTSDAEFESALSELAKQSDKILDRIILASNVNITTFEAAKLYSDYQYNITKDYNNKSYTVTVADTLAVTLEADDVEELMDVADYITDNESVTIKMILEGNIQLTTVDENNRFVSAMSTGRLQMDASMAESDFDILPYSTTKAVSTENELVDCLESLESTYEIPMLTQDITLTSIENYQIYYSLKDAVITNDNTVNCVIEVNGESEFIHELSRIKNLEQKGNDIKVKLTTSIELTSVENNTLYSEMSSYVDLNECTVTEYESL